MPKVNKSGANSLNPAERAELIQWLCKNFPRIKEEANAKAPVAAEASRELGFRISPANLRTVMTYVDPTYVFPVPPQYRSRRVPTTAEIALQSANAHSMDTLLELFGELEKRLSSIESHLARLQALPTDQTAASQKPPPIGPHPRKLSRLG